MTRNLFS